MLGSLGLKKCFEFHVRAVAEIEKELDRLSPRKKVRASESTDDSRIELVTRLMRAMVVIEDDAVRRVFRKEKPLDAEASGSAWRKLDAEIVAAKPRGVNDPLHHVMLAHVELLDWISSVRRNDGSAVKQRREYAEAKAEAEKRIRA